MVRRPVLPRVAAACAAAAAVSLSAAVSMRPSPAHADSTQTCAQTVGGSQQVPAVGSPCWVEVDPYPFGSDGNPVDLSMPPCQPQQLGIVAPSCYLTVTSLAFRSWNRGLAATSNRSGANNPFGVWLFNGSRWFPDPTFPGSRTCPGSVVLWAGKLDYWLIGGSGWHNLCRFDGSNFLWQPLPLPAQTVARGTALDKSFSQGNSTNTGITSGTCSAWNDCWFFGTYGTIVHWDGETLTDKSTDSSKPWLDAELTGGVVRRGGNGTPFGVAVGTSTLGSSTEGGPLPAQPDGSAPPQLFTLSGTTWTPTSYEPPTAPQVGDPYRTDLVAFDMDGSGHSWAAGNPAGFRVGRNPPGGRATVITPEPTPLLPLDSSGRSDPACTGPPLEHFTRTPPGAGHADDSYLWSSISVVPGGDGAIAGGQVFPAGSTVGEPVIVKLDCAGQSTVRRFQIQNPADTTGQPALVPANATGWVESVVATAANDAWAATSPGSTPAGAAPPRLYRLSDGRPPQAPAGDDIETRPLNLKQDPPIVVFDPLPPLPPPPPPPTTTTTQALPPAVTGIKSKLLVHTKRIRSTVRRHGRTFRRVRVEQSFMLRLTFRVARRTMLGLEARRDGRVVATTGLKTFAPPQGRLLLPLTRKKWPKSLRFITDAPTALLTNPGTALTGTVTLTATGSAIKGRSIASIEFDYAPTGGTTWTEIGGASSPPYSTAFDTGTVPNGMYDLRAVATDSTGVKGVSGTTTVQIENGMRR